MSFFSRLKLALSILFGGELPAAAPSLPAPTEPTKPQLPPPAPVLTPEQQHAAGLFLLGLLQREGRLLDFLQEDVSSFSDGDVGAAARVVHEGCRKALQQYVPLVWAMGMEMAIGGVDHVTPDNIGVGHQAYSYLRSLGCEETAFITTDPRWPLMRLRGQAFLNSAFDDGHPATAYLCGEDPSVGAPYGRQVVLAPDLDKLIGKLVKAKPFPTGLFIGNDLTTSYVYPLLADHGIKPGQDVHIVSCDNEDARLAAMHPRPASIDIGAEQIGIRAVNRLMNRIQHPNDPPLIIQVAARLIPPPAATPR